MIKTMPCFAASLPLGVIITLFIIMIVNISEGQVEPMICWFAWHLQCNSRFEVLVVLFQRGTAGLVLEVLAKVRGLHLKSFWRRHVHVVWGMVQLCVNVLPVILTTTMEEKSPIASGCVKARMLVLSWQQEVV